MRRNIGALRSSREAVAIISLRRDRDRRTGSNRGHAADRPPAHYIPRRVVGQPMLASAEGQFVYPVEDRPFPNVVGKRTPIGPAIIIIGKRPAGIGAQRTPDVVDIGKKL